MFSLGWKKLWFKVVGLHVFFCAFSGKAWTTSTPLVSAVKFGPIFF